MDIIKRIMEAITITNMPQIMERIVTNSNKVKIAVQIIDQQVEISKWVNKIKKIKLFIKRNVKSSRIQGILIVKIYLS